MKAGLAAPMEGSS
uniref:Uncharacterized protein n=1 Tax=Rhizophora mucronata TaxID=61149 RepID=A0A2P2Q7Y5_RHIMU